MKRSLSFVTAALVTLAGGAAYAESFQLNHGPRTPAAAGTVDFSQKEGNNKVSLDAKYLAPPQAVDPNAKMYAVWIDPGGGRGPQLVGTLTPNDKREAKLDVSTPYPGFDMIVTAESQATPMQPSSLVVLRGHVGKRQQGQQSEQEQGLSGGQMESGRQQQGQGGLQSGGQQQSQGGGQQQEQSGGMQSGGQQQDQGGGL